MIPDKRKNKVYSREQLAKLQARPPTTDLQKLAQKENFALFQLASIKSQLRSIHWGISNPFVRLALEDIKKDVEFVVTHIKCEQSDRKRAIKLKDSK